MVVPVPRDRREAARRNGDHSGPLSFPGPAPEARRVTLTIPLPSVAVELAGDLMVPDRPVGLVAFAHGSGSGRSSSRNRSVAATLQRAGIATLLFGLLTPAEEGDRALVFDVELLALRLVAATGWVR